MPEGLSPGPGDSGRVEVHRSPGAGACRERALVLQAVGIAHELVERGGEHRLLVAARDAEAAREQIRRFEDENVEVPPPDDRLELRAGFRAGAACWSMALCLLYVADRVGAGRLSWRPTGEAQASAIRDGELWRALTALGLHADLAHLAGNLLFGSLFVGAVCQSAGTGAGLLLTLLSGALGNLAAAFLRDGGGTSVGASTAVFGALGLLAALQWRRRRRRRASALRRWTPIVAAALLLGYLGASGARVDVLGHVTGFGCGLALGVAIEPRLEHLSGGRAQAAQGLVAVALVAGAWAWGFLYA